MEQTNYKPVPGASSSDDAALRSMHRAEEPFFSLPNGPVLDHVSELKQLQLSDLIDEIKSIRLYKLFEFYASGGK